MVEEVKWWNDFMSYSVFYYLIWDIWKINIGHSYIMYALVFSRNKLIFVVFRCIVFILLHVFFLWMSNKDCQRYNCMKPVLLLFVSFYFEGVDFCWSCSDVWTHLFIWPWGHQYFFYFLLDIEGKCLIVINKVKVTLARRGYFKLDGMFGQNIPKQYRVLFCG